MDRLSEDDFCIRHFDDPFAPPPLTDVLGFVIMVASGAYFVFWGVFGIDLLSFMLGHAGERIAHATIGLVTIWFLASGASRASSEDIFNN
jgi:uncharacterized membrane protein YuzA (DUF378 family)